MNVLYHFHDLVPLVFTLFVGQNLWDAAGGCYLSCSPSIMTVLLNCDLSAL